MQSYLCRVVSDNRNDVRRYIFDVFTTSIINFAVFDRRVLFYGTRDYLCVYTELAQVHVIR